jgi:undecaprenyl-diphosphatase
MSYWEAILLGFVQGLTEFLPISSDGHLILVEHILGRKVDNVAFNVALHAGTLLTIIVYFWKDLLRAAADRKLILAIIVATLPAIPVGLFLKDFIDETLNTPVAAAIGLLITAAFLFATAFVDRGQRELKDIRIRDALVIGALQALAPAPGVSRSGSTIFGGLICGLTRDAAARFAFLIAVPAIGGALVLYTKHLVENKSGGIALGPAFVGAVVAFVVGLVAVRLLMAVVVRRQLKGFAWYCLALGLAVLVASQLGKI